MQTLSCILLLIERGPLVHRGLNKALTLARHAGARLELFLCDTARYLPSHTEAEARVPAWAMCVAEGRDYLRALRHSILSPDVDIGVEATCALSLTEALVEKLQRTPAQLLVRAIGSHRFGTQDWRLLSRSRVPLLLTQGLPWQPVPQFAAIVDFSAQADRCLRERIVEVSQTLAQSCGARLDFLHAQLSPPAENLTGPINRPEALSHKTGLPASGLRYQAAELCEVPPVPNHNDYDLIAVGLDAQELRSKHRQDLTNELLLHLNGDALFVPTPRHVGCCHADH